MDCSLSGSSTHGILQARVLEWVAIAFSSRRDYWCVNSKIQGRGGFKKKMATWVRSCAESGRMNSEEEILAPTELRDAHREGGQTRMHGTRKRERGQPPILQRDCGVLSYGLILGGAQPRIFEHID